jgi:phosphoribosylanthranilate isomerase
MLVKICGLTSRKDAEMAAVAGADLVGFVFVPGTPRAVELGGASWIRDIGGAETVGVFRDASLELIVELRNRLGLDWIQLHGSEPETQIHSLGPRVIRRVRPRDGGGWNEVRRLADHCLPLLDPGAGSGEAWDWNAMEAPPDGLRFGLAGGLGPHNVADAVRRLGPALVDVSSGVESVPGEKEPDLVEDFISNARMAAAQMGRE